MRPILITSVLAVTVVAAASVFAADPFDTEQWPPARTLVWARPGTSGLVYDAGNWTEYASAEDYAAGKAGRPATRSPDKDTDVFLPDAPDGQSYVVGYIVIPRYRKRDGGYDHPPWFCRHVTIGRGAGLDGGCSLSRGAASFSPGPLYDTPMGIYGNVTVKDGGYIYGPHIFLGDKHTRLRIGNSPELLGKSLTVRKTGGASVTLESPSYELAQGVKIESGRLVLASGTHLRFGTGHQRRIDLKKLRTAGHFQAEYYVFVYEQGALELRPGSRIGRAKPPENVVADLRIEGLLQIGHADQNADEPAVIELGMAEGDGGFLTQHGGLYIHPTATVKNFGKLAITSCDRENPATADQGVSIFLEKEVDLGDVSFDYLRPGGIAANDVRTAKTAVAKAMFGQHNAAHGDDLFSEFKFINFQGGPGSVEFVDGVKTDCRILYPHAGRLIVRGPGNRTLQSFDLKTVHAITIADRRTQYNAKRPLTDAEKELCRLNPLWPDIPGKGQLGRYADHQWKDSPVMVWARPGQSGLRFTGPNWLDENGVPYFETSLGEYPDIDMLLPASATPYAATGWGRGGNEGGPPQRHLTIEQGAAYGSTFNIQGNLWMKHGSGIGGWHRGRFVNDQPGVHRFLRFDGKRNGYRQGAIDGPLLPSRETSIAQWGHFTTGDGGSVELIGQIRAADDRLYIDGSGEVIISEGSELADGARAGVWIMPDATLVLLQNALVGTETIMQHPQCYASLLISGTLRVGHPDKPIYKDMRFPLSGVMKDAINRSPGIDMRCAGSSFVLSEMGRFEIHSADPQEARVVFKMHDTERALAQGARYSRGGKPEGISCYLAGETSVDGIVFDNVYSGGIVVAPKTRAAWKNVFYGENNLAEPDDLYRDLER